MERTLPDIYGYINYRDFLRDVYAALKKQDPKYSFRFFAARVGSSSPSWLSDIIKGRINLTDNYLYRLCEFLGLRTLERSFFKLLVDYNQAASPEQRKESLYAILSSRSFKIDLITRHKFEYFSRWYIPVIRELLFIYPVTMDDTRLLAQKLVPSITPKEAKHACEILLSLDLIRCDAQGLLRPTETVIKMDRSEKCAHIPAYHQENLRLASEAIERFPAEVRDISSITLSLSPERLLEAKEEIRKLRKTLLHLAHLSGPDSRVFQCNIQLYPVSK